MLPTKFRDIWQTSFREEDFKKSSKIWPIREKNCLWWPCLSMDRDKMSNLYRGPSIDASYQVSVHLGRQFQRRRFFRNRPIRNKNCLWWPCLLMDRDEISNLYRRPSIDAPCQVSVHSLKGFQGRRFVYIGQSETRIACGGYDCWCIRTKLANFIEDLP